MGLVSTYLNDTDESLGVGQRDQRFDRALRENMACHCLLVQIFERALSKTQTQVRRITTIQCANYVQEQGSDDLYDRYNYVVTHLSRCSRRVAIALPQPLAWRTKRIARVL